MKKQNKQKNIVILHGEAMIVPAPALPEGAVKIEPSNNSYQVIADSETTGNHHVVDSGEGVFFFQKGDSLFMQNSEPTRVRCLHENRHSTIEIPPGTWEFGSQQEYDHLEQEMRKVRD